MVVLTTGCSTLIHLKPARMTEVPRTAPPLASADMATVVFLRPWPGGLGDAAASVAVIDEEGHWVGDAVTQSHFVASVTPGGHMFYAWSTETAALKATLAPGRVYYVEMYGKAGISYEPRVAMEALTPHHKDWQYLQDWLGGTTRYEPMPSGNAYFEQRGDEVAAHVKDGEKTWENYNSAEKMQRTLHEEDGVTQAGAAQAGR
jgi:hypothetical protein